MISKDTLVVGGFYNFKSQPERLVFLGSAGQWCRFALVEKPEIIWCEIPQCDLWLIEATGEPATETKVASDNVVNLASAPTTDKAVHLSLASRMRNVVKKDNLPDNHALATAARELENAAEQHFDLDAISTCQFLVYWAAAVNEWNMYHRYTWDGPLND